MEYSDSSVEVSQKEIDAKEGLPLFFHGKGAEFFKIHIVNILLTVITLGLYYPWAKAKLLQYNYGETELKGDRFTFHGTGKEMFKGMLISVLVLGGVYAFLIFAMSQVERTQDPTLMFVALAVFYVVIFAFIPFAIVGSVKYRASRSSWRGIHFQYVGTLSNMYKLFLKGILLTIVTFGIYGAWFAVSLYKEIYGNLRWGNIKLSFKGEGSELFVLQLLGGFLTYITLGIYAFKYMSKMFNFKIDNVRMDQEGNTGGLEAKTTGMGMFKLLVGNFFIVVFTLGLGLPYAMVRTMKYYAASIKVKGYVDFDKLEQGEIQDTNATGEGFLDGLDIDVGF